MKIATLVEVNSELIEFTTENDFHVRIQYPLLGDIMEELMDEIKFYLGDRFAYLERNLESMVRLEDIFDVEPETIREVLQEIWDERELSIDTMGVSLLN